MTDTARPLSGRVALVAGGTRGGGRGIAVELGAAGATVYVTGRSSAAGRSEMNRPETIEETAAQVTAAGGTGIAVRTDHSRPEEVRALVERIAAEQDGRLDVLVNGVWGGDPLTDWDHPLWEQDLDLGFRLLRQAVGTHIITSRHALPLMVARRTGLVVEVTDGNTARYRGSLFYDLAKSSVIRLAVAQAAELKPHGVAAVAITPGFLRSEEVLDHFGVTEPTWRDAIAQDPHFAYSETPAYLGRAVSALAADPNVMARSGRALATWACTATTGSPTSTAPSRTGRRTGTRRWWPSTDRSAPRCEARSGAGGPRPRREPGEAGIRRSRPFPPEVIGIRRDEGWGRELGRPEEAGRAAGHRAGAVVGGGRGRAARRVGHRHR